ncbi:MAG: signal peptidase I [Chloroflexota bacterium]|nr:signal peptidase I [Chloroflexota bacterium]PLS77884.1 MAG: signal peptidase I [Chloroflexota bacterium]
MNYQPMDHHAQSSLAGGEPLWEAQEDADVARAAVGATARELIETALFILVIFFIFRGVLQNYRVQGQSMEPNLHTDQYLIVNKIVFFHFDANAPLRLLPGLRSLPADMLYPLRQPERGDVVIVEEPPVDGGPQPEEILIKRVIGLPGETVQVKDGVVYINGQELKERQADGGYLVEETHCNGGRLCEPYLVPAGHIVVLGDHRSNSLDSRSWNAEPGVALDHVIGKAWLSYWPRPAWGVIATPNYAGMSK